MILFTYYIYICVYVSDRRYFSSPNLFMPPFGREPGEKDTKPLPFLSLSNAAKPRRRATSATRAFAPEGAARCDGLEAPAATVGSKQELPKVARPFQDEPGEGDLDKTAKRPKKQGTSSKKPFQDECAEDFSPPASDDSDDSPKDYQSKSQSVFSLGWQSMLTLQKAGFGKITKMMANLQRKNVHMTIASEVLKHCIYRKMEMFSKNEGLMNPDSSCYSDNNHAGVP